MLSNHKDGPSSGYSTADPLKGAHVLPDINTDKATVAQAWKEAEQQQEESDRASNDELNKNDKASPREDGDDHEEEGGNNDDGEQNEE